MSPYHPFQQGSGASPAAGSRAVQAVLERLRQMVLPRLELACGEALSKADDSMFDLAQNARNNSARESYFDAMREVRRERRQIEALFRNEIQAGFDEFLRPDAMAPPPPPPRAGEMSLVAQEELEEQLAADQSASTLHRRFKLVLEPILRGFTKMAVTTCPNYDPARGPIAPERFTNAFRIASGAFSATTEVKLVLFKLYERELMQALETLYPECLRVLSEAGQIQGVVPRMPARSEPSLPRALQPDFHLDQVPSRERAQEPAYDANQAPDDNLMGNLQELLQIWRKVQQPGGGQPGAPGLAQRGAGVAGLRGMPPSMGMQALPEIEQPKLTSHDMLSVLSLFQTDLPDGLKSALKGSDHSLAQQLKRELLTGAAALGISKGDARLGDAEEDAIDVVGMMFEVFLDERDIKSDVRDQIARLLVPYIKVALLDRRLFLHKQHPARRLLNAIAEACEGNHGEGPHERELLERVGSSVERLVTEFNEDIAIFEMLEQELRTFIDQYRRRADLAERRVAEAQRGKERLEEARLRAESLLTRRIGERSIAPLALEDLRRYWAHHYAVLFLREGEDGDGCALALKTLDHLLALADVAFHTGGLTSVAETESLQPGLLAMLSSSGLAGEAAAECARGIAQHLMQPPPKAKAAAPVALAPADSAELPEPKSAAPAVASAAEVAHGESARPHPATARPLPQAEPAPALDADPADVVRLRQLTVGSWVEFVGDDDRAQPGKLSWISPISARMLFVNKRGARMHVASAEELAALMKQGKLRLRVADTAFDQAMHQVLGRLREGASAAGE
ncbi:MAG: DUF1631 domain-containing protein [Proteobacteria bacterium]|nr:DUF1631 domain-containing protein [Pseudomonadota bacterium]